MKKILFILIPVFMIFACSSVNIKKKPEANLEKFEIESFSLEDVTFLFHVSIKNPYPVSIKLKDISFKMSLEGKQMIKTNTGSGLNLKAGAKEITTFRVQLKYSDIAGIIRDYNNKKYLNSVLDITVTLPSCFIKAPPFKYSIRKKIPVIKPEIRLKKFRIKKGRINLLKGDINIIVSFDLEMKNSGTNAFFKNIDYGFYSGDNRLFGGKSSRLRRTSSKSILSVSNKISSRKAGMGLVKSLLQKNAHFSIRGYSNIKLPDSVKKEPVRLNFNLKGN